jgi:hypothetical protein
MIPISEFINFRAFIYQSHRIEPSMGRKIVIPVITIAVIRSHCQEITNGGMMGYLLTIDRGSVRVGGL